MSEPKSAEKRKDYEIFHEYLVATEDKSALVKHFNTSTLKDYATGRTPIPNISLSKRQKLYEITGLDIFKDDFDPSEFDPKKIISGEQSRQVLKSKLKYDGISVRKLSKDLNVSRDRLTKYLDDKPQNQDVKEIIERGLVSYFSDEKSDTAVVQNSGLVNKSLDSLAEKPDSVVSLIKGLYASIDGLKSVISEKSPEQIKAELLVDPETNLESRIGQVTTAIEVLANQVDYFRGASQDEREELAEKIDPELWGYVTGILGRIDRPAGAETVLRLLDRDNLGKK